MKRRFINKTNIIIILNAKDMPIHFKLNTLFCILLVHPSHWGKKAFHTCIEIESPYGSENCRSSVGWELHNITTNILITKIISPSSSLPPSSRLSPSWWLRPRGPHGWKISRRPQELYGSQTGTGRKFLFLLAVGPRSIMWKPHIRNNTIQ